jgi:pSer/pThr/pTyr-binding forkhead associated (FHA) protein
MLGQLVPCGGGRPIPLIKPRLLVGRQSTCDVPVPGATVSSRHCELELRDGYWFVRDLGSKNGTRINGAACASGRLLPHDVLSLAQHRYTVVYSLPGSQGERLAVEAPAGAPAKAQDHTEAAEGAVPEGVMNRPPSGQLVPCGGGDPIHLRKSRLVIGRHDGCDIVLRLGTVSARHCELEWIAGRWRVHDLGSRNGTRVDGMPCRTEWLSVGSILAVADQRFRLVDARTQEARPMGRGPAFALSLLEAAGLARPPRSHAQGRGAAGACQTGDSQ